MHISNEYVAAPKPAIVGGETAKTGYQENTAAEKKCGKIFPHRRLAAKIENCLVSKWNR
jgi:hypothetical protein